MKKSKSKLIRTVLFSATLASVFMFASCNQNRNTQDSKDIAEDNNEAMFSKEKENDAEFLVSAAEINLEEIELGKLAQKNSSMPDVIALGKMMEEEHSKALIDLQMLAKNKQITVPNIITDKGKDAYNKLKVLSGEAFDYEYCDMMVKGHEDAISKFEEGLSETKDTDIKTWANEMIISLRLHLSKSISCKEKCAKMKTKS